MRVKVLGKYGPYPKNGGATSAYLLTSDSATVAFELGAGAFVRLINSADISKLDAIIISHFHFDHCSDVGVLGYYLLRLSAAGKVNLPVKLYCPESDSPLLIAFKNMKAFDVITVGDGRLTVMHTPGHTPGSMCLVTGDTVISGDTLFRESIGRYDFPGGDYGTIMKSLDKFKALEGDYKILPGHGPSTTLSHEKEYNLYLQ